MLIPKWYLFILLTITFYSCKTSNNKYPFAIKDFPQNLQPNLVRIVEKGIVMGRDSALQYMASDADLQRLGLSEHPMLRAAAFREMLKRPSFNHFEIVMNHLDDTALVFIDAGEFGIEDRMVSDDILQRVEWTTQEAKDKTVDQVLFKHNYLRSAYIVLQSLKPEDKYYFIVKDMATRPRRLDSDETYELGFDDIEYALYGLAGFRNKDDAQIIKKKLLANVWRISDVSFEFMKLYPDTAYFDVLRAYHRRQFYRFSGNRPNGFTGFPADRASPEDFINALVAQKSENSAMLLDSMLTYLPKHKSLPDKETIINEVVTAIWENPCPAYEKLRVKIKSRAEEIAKWQISVPIDMSERHIDTTTKKIRWYP